MVTDLPTTFVTATVNGRTKRIEDYVAAPDALVAFEREIDAAAGTKRWVFLDEDAFAVPAGCSAYGLLGRQVRTVTPLLLAKRGPPRVAPCAIAQSGRASCDRNRSAASGRTRPSGRMRCARSSSKPQSW